MDRGAAFIQIRSKMINREAFGDEVLGPQIGIEERVKVKDYFFDYFFGY